MTTVARTLPAFYLSKKHDTANDSGLMAACGSKEEVWREGGEHEYDTALDSTKITCVCMGFILKGITDGCLIITPVPGEVQIGSW